MMAAFLSSYRSTASLWRKQAFRRWVVVVLITVLNCFRTAAADENTLESSRLLSNPYVVDINRTCGPRCLKFLDALYGGTTSYDEIVTLCTPGRTGTSMNQLQSAAHKMGYHTRAVHATLAQLAQLDYRAILHLKTSGSDIGHFIVWMGWDGDTGSAQIFSPPWQVEYMPTDLLDDQFSGIAMLVSKTPIPEELNVSMPSVRFIHWIGLGMLLISFIYIARLALRGRTSAATVLGACLIISLFISTGCSYSERGEANFVDMGTVKEGTELTNAFTLRNTSSNPFKVIKVDRPCACQPVDVPVGKTIHPNETFTVKVSVPTKGHAGQLQTRFVVRTDAAVNELQAISLTVAANVEAKLRINPQQIHFGNAAANNANVKELRIESNLPGMLNRFQGAEVDTPTLQAKLLKKSPDTLLLGVELAKDAPPGDIFGTVTLRFDDPDYAELRIPVVGRLVGELRSIPSRIVLQNENHNTSESRRIRIKSMDDRSFQITRIDCPDWIRIDLPDSTTQASFDLNVNLTTPKLPEKASIIVHTDLQRNQSIAIPIVHLEIPTSSSSSSDLDFEVGDISGTSLIKASRGERDVQR